MLLISSWKRWGKSGAGGIHIHMVATTDSHLLPGFTWVSGTTSSVATFYTSPKFSAWAVRCKVRKEEWSRSQSFSQAVMASLWACVLPAYPWSWTCTEGHCDGQYWLTVISWVLQQEENCWLWTTDMITNLNWRADSNFLFSLLQLFQRFLKHPVPWVKFLSAWVAWIFVFGTVFWKTQEIRNWPKIMN